MGAVASGGQLAGCGQWPHVLGEAPVTGDVPQDPVVALGLCNPFLTDTAGDSSPPPARSQR